MSSDAANSHIMHTYGRLPVEFVRGEGVRLFDKDDRPYIDAISGIGVCALGHSHPKVTSAITEQASQLLHTSNLYHIQTQQALADKLCSVSGMENVFFGNSGAEANEAAIKMARLHGSKKGIEEPTVIVFDNAFHGRTLATLTASGNRKIQAGFEPLVKGFARAPFGDLDAVQGFAKNKNIVAILVEPIQGEGGLNMPPQGFLRGLRELCNQNDWLLMLDEVQTGNGRTGQYFAYQHEGILPDVVTTAKGLGNGVPIGACLASGAAAELLQPGSHGSTYGGNPLVCAAALATVSTLIDDQIIKDISDKSDFFKELLQSKLGQNSLVKEIRLKGLMIGIELYEDCPELVSKALDKGLLINVTAGSVIRLLPPLIINKEELSQVADTLAELVEQKAAHKAA